MSPVFCYPKTGPILAACIHCFLRGRAKFLTISFHLSPPEFYLSSETKIEPGLRLVYWWHGIQQY